MAKKRSKTICVFSSKGGVGKTTTVLNLAGIYSTLNKKVLIIDFDLFGGGIALALNKEPEKSIFDLSFDLENKKYKDLNDYTESYNEYIDFLAAPKDPRNANRVNSSLISLILDRATYLYDIILIDTNQVLNEFNLSTLDIVDKILFIVTNDPFDVKNMKSFISIFKELGINKYKLLLNNSRDPFKDYFSIYDLRSILNTNLDYTISQDMYLKDMENYVMNGKILTLEARAASVFSKDYNVLMTAALDLMGSDGEDEQK